MNTSNNFTVVGFICNDAEVRNFEKSSIARFGVSIKTTEKKGGVDHHVIKLIATSLSEVETQKKEEAA